MTPRLSAVRDSSIGEQTGLVVELIARFGSDGYITAVQSTKDEIPTIWVEKHRLHEILRYILADPIQDIPLLKLGNPPSGGKVYGKGGKARCENR